MLKKWKKTKSKSAKSKKHKSKIKGEKRGNKGKSKREKNMKHNDLSICIFFALILLFRFAKKREIKANKKQIYFFFPF